MFESQLLHPEIECLSNKHSICYSNKTKPKMRIVFARTRFFCWRDGQVECQGYWLDDTRWSFMEMTQHASLLMAPASACTLHALQKEKSGKFLARSCEMLKGFYPSVADSFPSWASPVEKRKKKKREQYRRRLCGFRWSSRLLTPSSIASPTPVVVAEPPDTVVYQPVLVVCVPFFFSLFGYKSRVDLLLDCLFGFVSYPIRFGKLKNISLFFSDCVIVSEVVAPRWNRRRLDAVALIYSSLVFSIIGSMARVD